VPFAIVGIIAVVAYNLPSARETRARAMAADPLVVAAKEMPAFTDARRVGDCNYSTKGIAQRLYSCSYVTSAGFDEVRQFYGGALERRGWTPSHVTPPYAYWCRHEQRVDIEYDPFPLPSHGWRYVLSFSVGVPPNPCGV
jgi:hypothetical protein